MAQQGSFRTVATLLAVAAFVFLAGEFLLYSRTAEGRLYLAQHGVIFSKSEVRLALSNTVRSTFRRLGVGNAAQDIEVREDDRGAIVRWTAKLPARASLLQTNAALVEAVEARGGRVFDAWEETSDKEGALVILTIGVGQLVTHEVRLVRGIEQGEDGPVLLALILEGFARQDADSLARLALEADFEFTGAVLTNGRHPRKWAGDLARAQREIVALVPMEPMNYPSRNPGRDAIRVDMTRNQVRRLVSRHLGEARDPVAYLPYMGGMALRDARIMEAVCEELRRRQAAYLEPPGMEESKGLDAAARSEVPFLRLDLRVLPPSTPRGFEKELSKQLAELTDTARRRGFAAAALPLEAATLRVLRREAPRWEKQGVRLVPLSALLRPGAA